MDKYVKCQNLSYHANKLLKGEYKMIININKPSCYETKRYIKKGELLIGNTTEFDLTEGKIYVAIKNQGEETFGDCVYVINDQGMEQDCSVEYFCHYEGELVCTG